MRKAVLYGFVLVCVTAASFLTVSPVERKIFNPDGTTTTAPSRPTQVEVTNFPAVQTVSGTVNVGNLTTDNEGRLLVSTQSGSPRALVLHSTSATYQGNLGGRTGATQKCQAEFPGSHLAGAQEVFNASGAGTSFAAPGIIWLTSETSVSWVDQFGGGASCGNWLRVTNQTGGVDNGPGLLPKGEGISSDILCDQFLPILCAE